MEYIVACSSPERLEALRAFAALLATLPGALAGGATAWPRWPPSRTTTGPGGCGCPWARPRPPATPTCGWCADQGVLTPAVTDRCETVERNGGRRERRICTVLGGPGLGEQVADPEAWPGLRSLVRVQAERNGPRGRQRSVRYYISSCPPKAEALLALVRGHWGVENGLHRTLDVQFREDDCRMRKGNAPAVMAVLRRAALNMLRTIQRKLETDVSIGLLRDRIGRRPWILAAALP